MAVRIVAGALPWRRCRGRLCWWSGLCRCFSWRVVLGSPTPVSKRHFGRRQPFCGPQTPDKQPTRFFLQEFTRRRRRSFCTEKMNAAASSRASLTFDSPPSDPGAPKKIQPLPEDAHLLESLSASNQTSAGLGDDDAKQARQLVDTTFRFCVSDSIGNVIKGLPRAVIKCDRRSSRRIVRCCHRQSTLPLPVVTG